MKEEDLDVVYKATVDDDGVLTLPDEVIKELGWETGDTLQWIDNEDGSWTLKNVTDEVEDLGESSGDESGQEG